MTFILLCDIILCNYTNGCIRACNMTQKKFTLVELLLVMAVIMLLAALLFPALSTVRSTAKRIKCVSNQRQIGCTVNLYEMDYYGYAPPARHFLPSNTLWWQSFLSPYLAKPTKTPIPELFYCPAMTSKTYYVCQYVVNGHLAFTWRLDGTTSSVPRLYTLKKPSRTMILVDGNSGGSAIDTINRTIPSSIYCSVGFVHGSRGYEGSKAGGSNILYVDGHVEFHVPSPVYGFGGPWGSTNTAIARQPGGLLWE